MPLAHCGTIWAVLGAFTDQAHNMILLAEDEREWLGQPAVEPQHLLLALLRHGNVRRLFAERRVTGSDVYTAIVGASGVGIKIHQLRLRKQTCRKTAHLGSVRS